MPVEIATPAGTVVLRAETAADAAFRLALFSASRGPEWALFPQGPALDQLMQMQLRGQTMSHAARHPDARLDIVDLDGAPAGRLAVDRAAGGIVLVDIALAPDARGRGIGSAIIAALLAEARDTGRPLRLAVATCNDAALRLYLRLGFAATSQDDAYLHMEWRAP